MKKERSCPQNGISTISICFIGQAEGPATLYIVEKIRDSLTGYDIIYIKKCAEGHTVDDPDVHSDGEYAIEIAIRERLK